MVNRGFFDGELLGSSVTALVAIRTELTGFTLDTAVVGHLAGLYFELFLPGPGVWRAWLEEVGVLEV